jgi:addiction module HigA family antidote
VTAETALLLARRFGTSAEFWMNLQTAHDLEPARKATGIAA